MNLCGQNVIHKAFGKGQVKSQTQNHITVVFEQGEKLFVYPDAFEKYLSLLNPELSSQMEEYFNARQERKRKQAELRNKERERQLERQIDKPVKKVEPKKKSKEFPRSNIAFKCNFCDGGKTKNRIGYCGVCSDSMIKYNIETARHVWCSSAECPCKNYLDGEITRSELERFMIQEDNSGYVCYESSMLRDWRAAAGIIQTGENKGKPMRLMKVQPNSLAVLTTREPMETDDKRFIFAVFLVDETYEGDNRDEGYVSTKSEYKLEMNSFEAKQLKFWNYYFNPNAPELIKFGSGLHRYLSHEQAAQILRDIMNVKVGTKDELLAKRFFQYFCKINGIDSTDIPEFNGALRRNKVID